MFIYRRKSDEITIEHYKDSITHNILHLMLSNVMDFEDHYLEKKSISDICIALNITEIQLNINI